MPKAVKKNEPAAKMSKEQIAKAERSKRVETLVDFAFKSARERAQGAEAILVTTHIVKADEKGHKRLISSFQYTDFPTADFGTAMIALGVEARNAALQSASGQSKAG